MGCLPFPKVIHQIIMLPQTLLNSKRRVLFIATRAFQVLVLELRRPQFCRQAIAYFITCGRCFT